VQSTLLLGASGQGRDDGAGVGRRVAPDAARRFRGRRDRADPLLEAHGFDVGARGDLSVLRRRHAGDDADGCLPFLLELPACGSRLKPKAGDCCVFCSTGSVKFAPKQAERECCNEVCEWWQVS
jgi:hypothetical protein